MCCIKTVVDNIMIAFVEALQNSDNVTLVVSFCERRVSFSSAYLRAC